MLQDKLKSFCRFLMPAKKNDDDNTVDLDSIPEDQYVQILYKPSDKENTINEKAVLESEWWIN